MQRDLNEEQLQQEVTVSLPLSVVLRISGAAVPKSALSARLDELRENGPKIGDKGLHGIYAGNVRGFDGEPDGILEVLDEADGLMTWEQAKEWAASVGGQLPNRRELRVLWANVPELFKTDEYYWSSEQHASGPSYAWVQSFGHGSQVSYHASTKYRARAVRRVPIR